MSSNNPYLDIAMRGAPGGSGATAPAGGYTDNPYLDIAMRPADAPAAPAGGAIARALGLAGTVLGAPKAGVDWLGRQVAEAEGIPQAPGTTLGQMFRAAPLGSLAPGLSAGEAPSYAGRLAGKALEFGADLATDPVTYLAGAAGKAAPVAGRIAQVLFGAQMARGAVEEGSQALDTIRHEGFTPLAAEQALGTGLSAGGAFLAAKHGINEMREPAARARFAQEQGRDAAANLGTMAGTARPNTVPANPDILNVLKRDAAGREMDSTIARAEAARRSPLAEAMEQEEAMARGEEEATQAPRERTPLPEPPAPLYGPDGRIIQPFVPADHGVLQRLRDANARETPPIPATPGTVRPNPRILDVLRQANEPPDVWQGDTPAGFDAPGEMRSPDEVRADMLAEQERQRAEQPEPTAAAPGEPASQAQPAPTVYDQLTSQERALLAHTGIKGISGVNFHFKTPEDARAYLRPIMEMEQQSRARAAAEQTPTADGRLFTSPVSEPPKGGGAPPTAPAPAPIEVPFDVPAPEPLKASFGTDPSERQDYVDTVLLNAKKFGTTEGPGEHIDPVDGSRWFTHVQAGDPVAAVRIGTDGIVSDWVGKAKGHGFLVARRLMRLPVDESHIDPERLSPDSAGEMNDAMARGGKLADAIRSRLLDKSEPGADLEEHDARPEEANDSVPGPGAELAGGEAPELRLPERTGGTDGGGNPPTESGVRTAGGEGTGELGPVNLSERQPSEEFTRRREAKDHAKEWGVDASGAPFFWGDYDPRVLPSLRNDLAAIKDDINKSIGRERTIATKDGGQHSLGSLASRIAAEESRSVPRLDLLRELKLQRDLLAKGRELQGQHDLYEQHPFKGHDAGAPSAPTVGTIQPETGKPNLSETSSRYDIPATQERIATAEKSGLHKAGSYTVAETTPEMNRPARAMAARPDVIAHIDRAARAMGKAIGSTVKTLGLTTEGATHGHQSPQGMRFNPLAWYEAATEHVTRFQPGLERAVKNQDLTPRERAAARTAYADALAGEMARRAARIIGHEVAHYIVEDHGPEHDIVQRKMVRALAGRMADVRTSLKNAFLASGAGRGRFVDLMAEHLPAAQEHWRELPRGGESRSSGSVRGAGGTELVAGGRGGGEAPAESRGTGGAGPAGGVRPGGERGAGAVPAVSDVGRGGAAERGQSGAGSGVAADHRAAPRAAGVEADSTTKTHKFSNAQVDLPPADAQRVLAASRRAIPDSVLGGDGRELRPHVTVQYGIETVDPEPIRKALAGEGPVKVRLGKVSTFPPSEGSDGMDVVKVDVDSPDLRRLRQKIAAKVGAPGDSHADDYRPHVTLGYVQPGEGAAIARAHADILKGREITLDSLTFSGKDGKLHNVPLKGGVNLHERSPIRPIPPAAKPPMGRPMEPGEAHRVDRKVADLEGASPADAAKLSRNAPRTWESLDPKIQAVIDRATATPKTEADFYSKARSGRLNDVEVQALDGMVRGARESMDAAREALQKAQTEGRDTGTANVHVLRAALNQAVTSFAQAARSDAEAGTKLARALAARARVMEAAGRSTPEQFLRQVFRKIQGVTDEQAAALVEKMQTDPANLLDSLQHVMRATTSSRLIEAWKNGLVSGPGTQIANVMGNAADLPVRLAETLAASALDSLTGNKSRAKGEASHELRGAWNGALRGLPALMRDLSDVVHLKPERIDPANVEHLPAIPGKLGRAIRTPSRFLEAADQYFQEIGRSAELHKLAWREAKGDAAEAARLVEKPTKALQDAAEASAKSRTYKDPNKLAEWAIKMRADHPAMHVILPFVVTPANLARLAFQRTPAGFVEGFKALHEYNQAVKGKIAPAEIERLRGVALDKMARPLVGSAIMGSFYLMAKSGLMTGSGPTDQKEKNLLMDSGWQPYSFSLPVGEDGKRVYVPFNRLEPVSSLLGIAADMAEIQDQRKLGDMADKALGSIGSNFLSKTFLAGLSDAASAIAKPQQFASQYVSNLAGTVVPNIIAKGAQAIDPVLRDTKPESQGVAGIPERIGRSIMARTPGASTLLPARKTAVGEDAERPGGILSRFLLPSQITTDKGTDTAALEREMSRVGFVPSAPARTVQAMGRKVELTEDEYGKLLAAYQRAAEHAARAIKSPTYKGLPDTKDDAGSAMSKEKLLENYFDQMVRPTRTMLARRALQRAKASA